MQPPIEFDPRVAATKPRTAKKDPCPFCNREALTDILETRGDMIWLMNKYPVMNDTWQTILVESAECCSDIVTYERDEWRDIMAFGIEKWQETEARRDFVSVIYYRNFGPLSGGSIRHPHSQIIGFRRHDYRNAVTVSNLDGDVVMENEDVRCTLSSCPIGSLHEINVRLLRPEGIPTMADAVRHAVRWACSPGGWNYNSYNLFFYDLGAIYCKIVPRAVTSPFFHGYRLAQVLVPAERQRLIEDLSAHWAEEPVVDKSW